MEIEPYMANTGQIEASREDSMPKGNKHDSASLPDRFSPKRKSKHLEGWQWRESERQVERKERAKAKHFGLNDGVERSQDNLEFSIDREVNGDYATVSEIVGRVAKVFYHGEFINCPLKKGLALNLLQTLSVGDAVTIGIDGDGLVIEHLVKRKTVLSRLRRDSSRRSAANEKNEQVVAANIDVAVIVVATQNPPLHPRFIDRYLILVEHSGIEPIICLNKCDLGGNSGVLSSYRELGIEVVETSAVRDQGIDRLRDLIKGKTVVLVGQSGVGKSSLINAIAPGTNLRTGQTSEKTGRGKHTTTSSLLLAWNSDSYLIDTPGIRALEIWNITREDLQFYFNEIQELSSGCKYGNCIHYHELFEDCAVKRAVKEGRLSSARYDSYLRVLTDL